jgi:hypothetical protein
MGTQTRHLYRDDVLDRIGLPFEASPPGPLSTSWRGGTCLSRPTETGSFDLWALPLHEVERDRG